MIFEKIHLKVSGRLVLLLFGVTTGVFITIIFYSIPAVLEQAPEMKLFDMSPSGYSYEYARELLEAIGPEGREKYLMLQLPIDLIYPGRKTGSFVKMEFTGNFSPESSTSTGLSQKGSPDDRAESKLKGKRGKMKFRARAGNQVVDYVAMMDESGERLIGSYISKSPHDIGYFFIQNH